MVVVGSQHERKIGITIIDEADGEVRNIQLKIRVELHSNNQLDMPSKRSLKSSANYWHMVDLVWLILFPLLYLVH